MIPPQSGATSPKWSIKSAIGDSDYHLSNSFFTNLMLSTAIPLSLNRFQRAKDHWKVERRISWRLLRMSMTSSTWGKSLPRHCFLLGKMARKSLISHSSQFLDKSMDRHQTWSSWKLEVSSHWKAFGYGDEIRFSSAVSDGSWSGAPDFLCIFMYDIMCSHALQTHFSQFDWGRR